MSARIASSPASLSLGGVICRPDGTPKSRFNLIEKEMANPRLSILRYFFPCELMHNIPTRNAMADAVVDLIDVGSTNAEGRLNIYTESRIDLLAVVLLALPSFGPAVSGVAPGLTLPWTDPLAPGSGIASEFNIVDRDENEIMSGDVALSGDEINFPSLEIDVNDLVKILSASYTAAA